MEEEIVCELEDEASEAVSAEEEPKEKKQGALTIFVVGGLVVGGLVAGGLFCLGLRSGKVKLPHRAGMVKCEGIPKKLTASVSAECIEVTEEVLGDGIERFIGVSSHPRNLPAGQHASVGAIALAKAAGVSLSENQTFVIGHQRKYSPSKM